MKEEGGCGNGFPHPHTPHSVSLPLGVILQQTMKALQFHALVVPSLIVRLLVNLAEHPVQQRHVHLQLLELPEVCLVLLGGHAGLVGGAVTCCCWRGRQDGCGRCW